jgi:ubiquinone/menaquinone biosynthesis C-methylase UbiE
VDYDPEMLKVIPEEVLAKDYGCGNPAKYLNKGETVLDLGSGAGKACFIAAQVVGASGRVIGVDMTDDMLLVARRNAPVVAQRLGYSNVEFHKSRIQDLALDLDRLDSELKSATLSESSSFLGLLERTEQWRRAEPLIRSDSVDVVISNCVLNLVPSNHKGQLFAELFRVLKNGGRAVISDIVSDKLVPAHLQNDPNLWSGCISGALVEAAFLAAFAYAGFDRVQILQRAETPWKIVEGIAFRSITVAAYKGKGSLGLEAANQGCCSPPEKNCCSNDGPP